MSAENADSMVCGHRSNIFTLNSDHRSELILSGGNDCIVLCHDIKSQKPIEVMRYQSAVHSAEFIFDSSNIFMAATENGELDLRDLRCSEVTNQGTSIGKSKSVYRSLACHPNDNNIVAVTGRKTGVEIFDLRKLG